MPPRQRQDPDSGPGWSLRATSRSASQALVRAAGEFDLAAVPDVHRVIGEVAAGLSSPVLVVVDLTGVTFLDAAMLGALVTQRRALRDGGGDLQLTGVSTWVMRIVEICGLRSTLGL